MISLVQRVACARVEVAGRIVGAIDRGLLVFVCVEPDDDEAIADRLAAKLVRLRVFADGAGKMNLDLGAVGGALLLVSQFTLAADTTAGNRPSFVGAAAPAAGRRLFERVVASARIAGAGGVRRVRRRHAGASRQRRPGDASHRRSTLSAPRAMGIMRVCLRQSPPSILSSPQEGTPMSRLAQSQSHPRPMHPRINAPAWLRRCSLPAAALLVALGVARPMRGSPTRPTTRS